MPGRRLSREEKQLGEWWDQNSNAAVPTLRSIEISGAPGLRGIDGLIVHFRYPITAICGSNGAGKSTVLALAALAFHSPANWRVHKGFAQEEHISGDRTYYTFGDFFVQADGDAGFTGASIVWRYKLGSVEMETRVTKSAQRWGRYTSRPERSVHFLPLGRLMSAYEIRGIRSPFATPTPNPEPLSQQSRNDLSYIMGKTYSSADIQRAKRWRLQRCQAGAEYTAFNMGGGESCVISILHLLDALPNGGLLVVEEIEAGLHPQAQIRLAERLVARALTRQLQIVCTTHSEVFLDALPRQARLLLIKQGDEHVALESPSSRFALSVMTGRLHPELTIYCEDSAAATMIEEGLPQTLRPRVAIRQVGSSVTVVRQGVAHIRGELGGKCLCVLDGDCTQANVDAWQNSESAGNRSLHPQSIILPGSLAPERWALDQLATSPYDQRFAQEFNCSLQQGRAHVDALRAELNHHDIGYSLAQRTGFEPSDCLRRMFRAFAADHPQLDPLRTLTANLLT
jgi:predicted ATPase